MQLFSCGNSARKLHSLTPSSWNVHESNSIQAIAAALEVVCRLGMEFNYYIFSSSTIETTKIPEIPGNNLEQVLRQVPKLNHYEEYRQLNDYPINFANPQCKSDQAYFEPFKSNEPLSMEILRGISCLCSVRPWLIIRVREVELVANPSRNWRGSSARAEETAPLKKPTWRWRK